MLALLFLFATARRLSESLPAPCFSQRFFFSADNSCRITRHVKSSKNGIFQILMRSSLFCCWSWPSDRSPDARKWSWIASACGATCDGLSYKIVRSCPTTPVIHSAGTCPTGTTVQLNLSWNCRPFSCIDLVNFINCVSIPLVMHVKERSAVASFSDQVLHCCVGDARPRRNVLVCFLSCLFLLH